ncbi:MAG: hypothetical protein HZA36_03470 [Parcubacteria group bacterium]|nr:hypothetical protein [Parcubacteria group bacterium]
MKIDINTLTEQEFNELPLVIEGESKEVRYAGEGLVVIRFKPTIYSYTANRCGVVPGSDVLRLRATRVFLEVLRNAGIKHAYQEVNDRWVLAELLLPHEVECKKYGVPPFVVLDLTPFVVAHGFDVAPPIEIIVKRYHGGTSKHRYRGMDGSRVRSAHPLFRGLRIYNEGAYPLPIVRFDWRNPFQDEKGNRVQDEILPEDMASWYINVEKARETAKKVYAALDIFLGEHDIVCNDLCLFIGSGGELVYGEVSQDCGRFRHFDLGSLDKDVWRMGGSSEQVLEKWAKLLELISDSKEG